MDNRNAIHDFLADETAAVTVDFIILTAAICTLGAAVVLTVITGAHVASDATRDSLSSADIADIGPL